VGFEGTIIRWNGTDWTSFAIQTIGDLNSVSMVDSTDGWAVGNGVIIHRNGTVWSVQSPETFLTFESVYMLNADDGWAVGMMGQIIHWNGTEWTDVSYGNEHYESVFFVDPNDGWIAGDPGMLVEFGFPGPVFHWNGSAWSFITNPTTSPIRLSSVFMVNASDGWIVGEHGTIIRWNGIQWIPEFSTTTCVQIMAIMWTAAVVLTRISAKKRKPAHEDPSAISNTNHRCIKQHAFHPDVVEC
jgi:photosystem II stability/assembly factor-like uncharacterized protein